MKTINMSKSHSSHEVQLKRAMRKNIFFQKLANNLFRTYLINNTNPSIQPVTLLAIPQPLPAV